MERNQETRPPQPRPIYSITPFLGNLLWRNIYKTTRNPFGFGATTDRNVYTTHAWGALRNAEKVAALPSGEMARRFLARLPPVLEGDQSGNAEYIRQIAAAYEDTQKELADDGGGDRITGSDVEDSLLSQLDWTAIRKRAETGDIFAIAIMLTKCFETSDAAGLFFWNFVKNLACKPVLESVNMDPPLCPLETYQCGKLVHEMREYPDVRNALSTRDRGGRILLPCHTDAAVRTRNSLAVFYLVGDKARDAIGEWLRVGIRYGVVKDIRRLIGKLIWDMRHEWADSNF